MKTMRALDHAAAVALMKVVVPFARWRIAMAGADCHRSVRLIGVPIVQCVPDSTMSIEGGVVLCSSSRWTALGVSHPVILRTMRAGATLRIGRETGISGGAFCAAVKIDIGERCFFGADVIVCDSDFHSLDPQTRRNGDDWSQIDVAPVRIGNDVFVGTRATILKGVDVGDGAVIGAGSVVVRSVPSRAVVAGNPASVIGTV